MGLDWNPIGKPMPGHEAEFETLFNLLYDQPIKGSWLDKCKQLFRRVDLEAASKRWFEIQISPFVTLQAPQVGSDTRADEWAKAQYEKQSLNGKTEAQFLKDLKDYFVIALAPSCDGIPYYSNGPAGYVELCSFRAQFIKVDCGEIIDKTLLERCYESYLAPGLASLGMQLKACATKYAAAHSVLHVEKLRKLDAPEGSAESKAHILFSAARWCEYWSIRGHGLEAHF